MSCGKPEDDDGEMPVRRPQARSGKCVKCRVKDIEFAKMAAGYCKECFVIVLGRRFKDVAYLAREHCRAQKGAPSKMNASLLLAYSGSNASRAALELLKTVYFPDTEANSRTQPAFSRLEVLYVRRPADTDAVLDRHQQAVAKYGFELSVVDLDKVYEGSKTGIDLASPALNTSPSDATTPTLLEESTFTPTSQETLSSTILASFITKYAEEHGHKAVILCDTATKLAAKTLSAISKGQGWNLGELVGGADIPVAGSNLRLYRPLSSISDEEIRFFAEQVHDWPAESQSVKLSGIDGLVEGFVKNLEAGFPSTVSVISKTASKLGMRSVENSEQTSVCALCRLPRDPNTQAWRPVASLSSFNEGPLGPSSTSSAESLASSLCYGCLVPFMELQGPAKKTLVPTAEAQSSIRRLPAYVTLHAKSEANGDTEIERLDMRAQIEEFLL